MKISELKEDLKQIDAAIDYALKTVGDINVFIAGEPAGKEVNTIAVNIFTVGSSGQFIIKGIH